MSSQARKLPGVVRVDTVKGAAASAGDLTIPNYDSLSADELQDKLSGLSQIELAKVAAYERKNQNRSTVTGRIESLQGSEPWPGYDELTADEVRAVLSEGGEQRIKKCAPTSASTSRSSTVRGHEDSAWPLIVRDEADRGLLERPGL